MLLNVLVLQSASVRKQFCSPFESVGAGVGWIMVSPAYRFFPQREQAPAFLPTGQFAPEVLGRRGTPQPIHNARHTAFEMRMQGQDQRNKVLGSSHNFYHQSTF